jgi:Ca2+-binding RTX toxin-like protein
MALIESTAPLSSEGLQTILIQLDIGNVIQSENDVYSVQADGYTASLLGRHFEYNNTDHLESGRISDLVATTNTAHDLSVFLSATGLNVDVDRFHDLYLNNPEDGLKYILRGDDTVIANQTLVQNDAIYTYGGNDIVLAGPGDDQVHGGRGDDILRGQAGNDHLWGGRGDDVLDGGIGGLGKDILTGGSGADKFVFMADYGQDIITDFGRGDDRIQLSLADFKSFADIQHAWQQVGENVVITPVEPKIDGDTAQTLTIEHTNVADLTAHDFLLV